jgi:endonuclease/exonuclease/phosphatase family metal-dependent hydrolase
MDTVSHPSGPASLPGRGSQKPWKSLALALTLGLLLSACAGGGSAPASATPKAAEGIKVLTINCYCFPPDITFLTRMVTEFFAELGIGHTVNLTEGITQSIPGRIDLLARFIRTQNPDVICFQELWKDTNKRQMIRRLVSDYPFVFTHGALGDDTNPILMDDGLLIMSKYPAADPGRIQYVEYPDKEGEELLARKGAIVVELQHPAGNLLLATTHLQSGTGLSAVMIRDKQIRQLAQALGKAQDPSREAPPIALVGDLNDPIMYVEERGAVSRTLFDRSRWLVDSLNQQLESDGHGAGLGNRAELATLMAALPVEHLAIIQQLAGTGMLLDPTGTRRDPRGVDPEYLGQLDGRPEFGWSYFSGATDPAGIQILDHVFLQDDRIRLGACQVFRKEVLADERNQAGNGRTYNGDLALSDHAAVMVTLVPVRSATPR